MQFYPNSTLFAVHLALNPNNNRVPANVKAALTRKYNAAQKGVKAGVRATKVAKERLTEDAEDDDEEEDDDESEHYTHVLDAGGVATPWRTLGSLAQKAAKGGDNNKKNKGEAYEEEQEKPAFSAKDSEFRPRGRPTHRRGRRRAGPERAAEDCRVRPVRAVGSRPVGARVPPSLPPPAARYPGAPARKALLGPR